MLPMSGTPKTNLLVCLSGNKSIHLYIKEELLLSIDYVLDITGGQPCHPAVSI